MVTVFIFYIFLNLCLAQHGSRDLQSNPLPEAQENSLTSTFDHELPLSESIMSSVILPAQPLNELVVDKPGIQDNRDDIPKNSVNFSDSNLMGFNPFIIEPQFRNWGLKSFLAVVNVMSVIAPTAIVTPYQGDFGNSAMFLLQGVQMGFQPSFNDEAETFQQVFGSVQNLIFSIMDHQAVSQLVSKMQTLSQNINDIILAYLEQLGIGRDSVASLKAMVNGSRPIPWVYAKQVDIAMRGIDYILSSSDTWYRSADSVLSQENITDAFALTTGPGGVCLRTRTSLKDGSELVADSQCNLNNMQDKLWAIGKNGRLIMRTDFGDKCVAYKSASGTDFSKPLAIYDVSSFQCTYGSIISLKPSSRDNIWSLYDGNEELCLSDARKTKESRSRAFNGIVNTKSFKGFWFFKKHNKCKSLLRFTQMVPILINNQNAGGVTPPLSFSEIGVQIFYFTHFAGFHLAALKELYLHGTQKAYAKSQYYLKIKKYQKWIDTFVPVFREYAVFAEINATKQIDRVQAFGDGLEKVNLEYTPLKVSI